MSLHQIEQGYDKNKRATMACVVFKSNVNVMMNDRILALALPLSACRWMPWVIPDLVFFDGKWIESYLPSKVTCGIAIVHPSQTNSTSIFPKHLLWAQC